MTNRCPTCDRDTWSVSNKPHVCPPKWWCWHDDGPGGYYETDDGGKAVYADDAQAAAVKYCDGYPEHGMSDTETIVVKSHDGKWVKVAVSATWAWSADYGDPEPFVPKLRCPACHDRAAGANDVSMGLCQPCFDTAMSFMPTEETA